MSEYVLWYMRHGVPRYEIFDSEDEAASAAFHMIDSDAGSPEGVQLSDGRSIKLFDWQAYRDEEDRQHQLLLAEAVRTNGAPVTRTVRDPFSGLWARADPGDPPWLGEQS